MVIKELSFEFEIRTKKNVQFFKNSKNRTRLFFLITITERNTRLQVTEKSARVLIST